MRKLLKFWRANKTPGAGWDRLMVEQIEQNPRADFSTIWARGRDRRIAREQRGHRTPAAAGAHHAGRMAGSVEDSCHAAAAPARMSVARRMLGADRWRAFNRTAVLEARPGNRPTPVAVRISPGLAFLLGWRSGVMLVQSGKEIAMLNQTDRTCERRRSTKIIDAERQRCTDGDSQSLDVQGSDCPDISTLPLSGSGGKTESQQAQARTRPACGEFPGCRRRRFRISFRHRVYIFRPDKGTHWARQQQR